MRRSIILREFSPFETARHTPRSDYLIHCNNTVKEQEYVIRVDRDGFMSWPTDEPRSVSPVIYLGDSIIENYFVDEDQRTAVWVRRKLDQAGFNCTVLNGGMSAATTLDLFNVLVNKCVPLKPRAIVLTNGMIDLTLRATGGSMWARAINPPVDTETIERPDVLSERAMALSLIEAACRIAGIPLIITTWGCSDHIARCAGVRSFGELEFDWVAEARALNDGTRTFASRTQTPLVDLAAAMNDRDDLFYDGLHPNAQGCAVAGALVGAAIAAIIQT